VLAVTVLELRERLIFKFAVFAGLRPGEIFALRRERLSEKTADIQERIYRGKLDTPKTQRSMRVVALSASVREDLANWLVESPKGCEGWLFPSETLDTPLSKDNAFRRYIKPRLETVGLGWVDFQVMRRTHSSLMRELGVDPKTVADLMGHDVKVNLNVYTQTSVEARLQAVETLESALVN
jgi:integrase